MNMDQYIGRLLDNRYEILEIIGTGGMAVVYKARCHRLNRLVAIKILKDEFARDEEFVRRFHAEGEAVAMLSHPNIVQVFDVSSTDSANFIVMELVDGISMKQYMEKKGVLNWKETLHFSIQIAKGLEHAHSRGIVHRDIKPHNVMVLKNGSVKVMDFGIARVMSKSNTLTKEALGSVHYISPEQAKGGYTDNRSDLYSLGVVMYEMMTGRPPYDGESPVAVAIQHINGGAVMPTALNPNIPGAMEQIIMHAMALEPKDRYSSATEMLRDMDEFRKDPSIVLRYRKKTVSDDTQTVRLGELNQKPKTTAERVARARGDNPTVRVPDSPTSKVRTGTVRQAAVESAASRSAVASREEQIAAQRRRRREMEEEERRSRLTTIAIVACSAVAVIAIGIFLIALFSGALFGHKTELIEVPSLVGHYLRELEENTDYVVQQGTPEYHEEYDKGMIIHQEPASGTKMEKGSTITVIVSLGTRPTVAVMENLAGQDVEDAKNFLINQGMNPLTFEEHSSEIPEGKVIRTNPEPGTELTPGQKVEIYYSAGPVIKTAKVPNLVGLDYATAMKRLDDLGFSEVDVKWKTDDADKDEVIDQNWEPNTELDITETIVLTISKGPNIVKANVPNVEGLTLKQAIDRLHDFGFDNVREEYVQSNAPKDEVIAQSVEGSTLIDVQTQIVLTVSEGPAETQEPTTEPEPETEPQAKTVRMTITLPEREDAYVLSLRQNNRDVTEPATILPGTADITLELTGTGVQTYDLYINDEFYDSIDVDFTK